MKHHVEVETLECKLQGIKHNAGMVPFKSNIEYIILIQVKSKFV
jgi:hypothetical protein